MPLICVIVSLFVCRKKLAGFLSSYLSLLQGFRDFESGVPFTYLLEDREREGECKYWLS